MGFQSSPTVRPYERAMILHVDMDAFYASIEEREHPELAGLPVIVGGAPRGRGVVAAANYTARKFGIHSAMASSKAAKLCPNAVFLPTRIDYYAAVSEQIRSIFQTFTPLVEPLSLDEAFLDITESQKLFGTPESIGRQIQQTIQHQLNLVASVGIAPNKFLAKVASDLEKPAGFVVVHSNAIQTFLDPLPVRRLWGVGPATAAALEQLGIQTIGQVRLQPANALAERFGQHGAHLWNLAQGIDDRPVITDKVTKSISHETTFAVDVTDRDVLRAQALALTDQVAARLRVRGLSGKTVQLKIRFADFQTITRATTLSTPTQLTQPLWHAVQQLLTTNVPRPNVPIRLIGVGISSLDNDPQQQQELFPDKTAATQLQLEQTTDQIRQKFGATSVTRATTLLRELPSERRDGSFPTSTE